MEANLPHPGTGVRTAWIFTVPDFESDTSGGPLNNG